MNQKRRINYKALAILLGAAVVLGGSLHVLHGFQVKRSASGLLRQVSQFEQKGELARAVDYLERYLAYAPDDDRELEHYGRLLTDPALKAPPARRAQALSAFEKVLRRDPRREETRRRLVDQAVELAVELAANPQLEEYNYNLALAHLRILLDANPDDAQLHYQLGRCLEGLKQYREAADIQAPPEAAPGTSDAPAPAPAAPEKSAYTRARELKPSLIDAYIRQARVLRNHLNKPAEADRLMDARETKDGIVATNANDFRAYLERARYLREFRPDEPAAAAAADARVKEDIAKALQLRPDEPDVLVDAAREALDAKDIPAARTYLERCLKEWPKEVRAYAMMASLEHQAGREDEAMAVLRRGIEANPDDAQLRWILAEQLIQAKRPDLDDAKRAEYTAALEALIGQMKKLGYRSELIDYLTAWDLIRDEKWSQGASLMHVTAQRLATMPDLSNLAQRAYLLLGVGYDQLGDYEQAYNAYSRAADLPSGESSLRANARRGRADALSRSGRIDEAIEEYRKLVAQGAPPEVGVTLARLLILRNMRLPADRRRWDEIQPILDRVVQADPGSADALILKAEVLLAQGKPDPTGALRAARGMLEQERQKRPEQVELWTALAALAARQGGKPEDGLAVLDEAQRRLGDHVEIRLARARIGAGLGPEKAVALLEQLARGEEQYGAADRRKLRAGLAEAYATLGRAEESIALWNRLAAEDPKNLLMRLTIFDLALQNRDEPTMQRMIEQIRDIERVRDNEDEDGALWRYAEARMLIEKARDLVTQARKAAPGRALDALDAKQREQVEAWLLKALDNLAKVGRKRPSWSRVPRAEAEAADLLGNQEIALTKYRAAIDLGDHSPQIVGRAMQMLYERKDFATAERIFENLRDAAQQTPLSQELQKLAAQVSLENRNYDRALELAQRANLGQTTDYKDLLWLGQAYYAAAVQARADGKADRAKEQLEKADQALRLALERNRDVPETWVALVLHLARSGRLEEARTTIAQAELKLTPDRAAQALPPCYEAVGQFDKAEALYQAAAKARADDPEPLRNLAIFYLKTGRPRLAEQYLTKLNEPEFLAKQKEERQRWARNTLAIILAAGGDPQRSRRALELLGPDATAAAAPAAKAAGDDAATLSTRAKVLAMQGTPAGRRQAIEILGRVLAADPRRSADRHLLAQLLDADGNWPQARKEMNDLVTQNPRTATFLVTYIRALLRHEAVGEAATWLGRLEAIQPNAPVTKELRARVLVAQKRPEQAVALLRDFAKASTNPAQVAAIAHLMEELGQYGPAEELYRQYAEQNKAKLPEAVLVVAEFLGRRQRTDEALKICTDAWKTCKPALVANVCLAICTMAREDPGQLSQVESQIQEAIGADPENVDLKFALANLWALQQRYDDAEAAYRQIFEKDPKQVSPLNNLAWMLALRGTQVDEALKLINQAIDIRGPLPDLVDTRGLVYIALGQADKAVADLQDVLSRSPSALGHFHLAQAYSRAGKVEEAQEEFEAALEGRLTRESLHPLERPAFDRLREELRGKG